MVRSSQGTRPGVLLLACIFRLLREGALLFAAATGRKFEVRTYAFAAVFLFCALINQRIACHKTDASVM